MSQVLVPVSVGELIDKITILRIKRRMIKDAAKLRSIEQELTALEAVCREQDFDLNHRLVNQLESVNAKLWKIEDDIRDKERSKNFDSVFIDLARAVYVTNDERFTVKSQINAAFGSALREEKSYQPY